MEKFLSAAIAQAITTALQEDSAQHDITTHMLTDTKTVVQAEILAKQKLVICGLDLAEQLFKKLDPHCKIQRLVQDGQDCKKGQKLMRITGRARALLAAERSALNFLQHLSGVSTMTRQFVQQAAGRSAICDTRKTVPGLRILEKYAVRCGGGQNHRMSLQDMVLVKDNHWKLPGASAKIAQLKKTIKPATRLLIEVETRAQLFLALDARADIIMLDNMPLPKMKNYITCIRRQLPSAQIEISGGVKKHQVRALAKLGVDRISVGALTHSAPAADISLDLI